MYRPDNIKNIQQEAVRETLFQKPKTARKNFPLFTPAIMIHLPTFIQLQQSYCLRFPTPLEVVTPVVKEGS